MTATTANLLYLVFAFGGAGVYFLLPRGGRSNPIVGAILGLSTLVALLIVLGVGVIAPSPTTGCFYVLATIALFAAVRVVTHSRPVYSALYFVLVVVAVAALLLLQHAEFLAVALIIIYAGAILVTYLFVIMLAHAGGSSTYDRRAREPLLAVLAGFALMAAIAGRAGDLPAGQSPESARLAADVAYSSVFPDSNTMAIGATVMTKYVVALEIGGVLLLIAMVGAIALSRKQIPRGERPKPRVIGEIGKEVPPY